MGLTAVEYASRLGVSPSAVSLWESGKQTPGMPSLRRISSLAGITVAEFLTRADAAPAAEDEQTEPPTPAAA
jgi:transcriptional regulator with XRE-family HTH domain